MTGFLLDSHVLLWWLSDPARLSSDARDAIEDGLVPTCFSAAGAWELSIKKALGRVDFPDDLPRVLRRNRIDVIPIELADALAVSALPTVHQDPFDRMMVAQARSRDLTLISRDRIMKSYDIRVLDA